MFGLHHAHAHAAHHQDTALHPAVRNPAAVTTLKEEPLGSTQLASAHNFHHAARSWMQPAGIGVEHAG